MQRLIERENLISELKSLPEQERLEIMGVYDLIKSMPTIEAEPVVHAHWHTGMPFPICSNCNTVSACHSPYCGGCGAKMDEEKE